MHTPPWKLKPMLCCRESEESEAPNRIWKCLGHERMSNKLTKRSPMWLALTTHCTPLRCSSALLRCPSHCHQRTRGFLFNLLRTYQGTYSALLSREPAEFWPQVVLLSCTTMSEQIVWTYDEGTRCFDTALHWDQSCCATNAKHWNADW